MTVEFKIGEYTLLKSSLWHLIFFTAFKGQIPWREDMKLFVDGKEIERPAEWPE